MSTFVYQIGFQAQQNSVLGPRLGTGTIKYSYQGTAEQYLPWRDVDFTVSFPAVPNVGPLVFNNAMSIMTGGPIFYNAALLGEICFPNPTSHTPARLRNVVNNIMYDLTIFYSGPQNWWDLTVTQNGTSRSVWADAIDLRLLAWGPTSGGTGVPTAGKDLVVIGIDNIGMLHIRIFDTGGTRVADKDEKTLPVTQAGAISTLKQQLVQLLPPHVLTDAEKAELISEARSIVGLEPDLGSLFPLGPTPAL
jgi:hypothetical protein